MTEFKDFDSLLPERRVAKIAGREIDVSKIPARIVLEQAKFRDDILSGKVKSFLEQQKRTFEMVERICRVSDPDFKVENIIDDITVDQLLDFIDFVIEPLNRPRIKDNKKKVENQKK
jgi:hypothetical protein